VRRTLLFALAAFALTTGAATAAAPSFTSEELVGTSSDDLWAALEDALRDGPGWAGTLNVEPVELDEREVSAN
jgi:hypothetical protein